LWQMCECICNSISAEVNAEHHPAASIQHPAVRLWFIEFA